MYKNGLLVVISGPTASGKSDLSLKLARKYNSIIISADSRQFYREMKIGTCRITEDASQGIPVYFSGHLSVREYYSAGRFESDVISFLQERFQEYGIIFLAGGTGLYIDAVCRGIGGAPQVDLNIRKKVLEWNKRYGPEYLLEVLKEKDIAYFESVDKKNVKRLLRAVEVIQQTGKPYSEVRKSVAKIRPFNILKIGLIRNRDDLYARINSRVDEMIGNGLLEEVRRLYPFRDQVALQTVGYNELFDFLDGKCSMEEAIRQIKRNTRRYAKRQITWLKKDESIFWFKPGDTAEIERLINDHLSNLKK